MGAVKLWLARVLDLPKTPASPSLPALTIYPFLSPVTWPDYLEAWKRIIQKPEGAVIAGTISQNYARVLCAECPPTCKTMEEQMIWHAKQDGKKEAYGSLLTAATRHLRVGEDAKFKSTTGAP